MQEVVTGVGAAAAAWLALYFVGKPVAALQQQRIAALQTAERYYAVNPAEPDSAEAVKALFEAGVAVRTYDRAWSTATRLWCWACGYDLDLASRCLFGLSEGPRGEMEIPLEARRNTLNALYVALAADKHLSRETVAAIKDMVAQTKAAHRNKASADATSAPASTETT